MKFTYGVHGIKIEYEESDTSDEMNLAVTLINLLYRLLELTIKIKEVK